MRGNTHDSYGFAQDVEQPLDDGLPFDRFDPRRGNGQQHSHVYGRGTAEDAHRGVGGLSAGYRVLSGQVSGQRKLLFQLCPGRPGKGLPYAGPDDNKRADTGNPSAGHQQRKDGYHGLLCRTAGGKEGGRSGKTECKNRRVTGTGEACKNTAWTAVFRRKAGRLL